MRKIEKTGKNKKKDMVMGNDTVGGREGKSSCISMRLLGGAREGEQKYSFTWSSIRNQKPDKSKNKCAVS